VPQGHLSSRNCTAGDRHHLWNNNGTWWVHYTLHFGDRKRRIRRSLKTRLLEEAVRRRDELFAQIAREGEWVRERGDHRPCIVRHARHLVPCSAASKGGNAWTLLSTASCA
jgi:hypothetical protein